MSRYLILTLKGFCMGAADIVPGVSGGTMAFILGIYEELINAIKSFDLAALKLLMGGKVKEALKRTEWSFVLALLSGILIAIFSLAKGLSWLLANQPVPTWSFFMGLIVASVLTVSRKVNTISPAVIVWTALGAAGAWVLVGLVPSTTPATPLFLFASGAVAICAMILPGISGAFILVLLGKYQQILTAVHTSDFLTLLYVALGAGIGIILFSRVLSWLFRRWHDFTVAFLCGLMIGSLRKIWPWKQTVDTISSNTLPTMDGTFPIAVVCLCVGILIVLSLERRANR